MSIRTSVLSATAILLTASAVIAQDEQFTRGTVARFWSLPRVEQLPAENVSINNDLLQVDWNPALSQVTVTHKPTNRRFLTDGNFNTSGGSARVTRVSDKTFGSGQALEISYGNGSKDSVMLFSGLPFALFRSTVKNDTDAATITRSVRPFEAALNLGKPARDLKAFGTGGLTDINHSGSYTWLAVVEPESRNGVVMGWLTQDRGNGVLFSQTPNNNNVRVGGQIDYGRLRLAPGKSEDLETLAVGFFEDARLGLESWADQVAKIYNIKLRPQPTGYCTWYSQPHGGAADETSIITLSEFAAKELKPFGFSVVQIDDRWQAGWKRNSPSSPKKDFTKHDPSGPYPNGMKPVAEKIKALGLVPGIWFMPFAGTVGDPFFDAHPEWFVKTVDGKPYDTPWGGTCLDMTHPGARAHMQDVAGRICREWGYDYIKIDGLWTGTATRQMYVNSGYRDDQIGEAVFHDPDKTNIEAYRDGLKLLRETIGPDVFILGCNGPQNMRSYGGAFGLVDGMRVGPDNQSDWNRLTRGTIFGTRHYFLHGRVWWNDPDPVYVRASMPINHAQLICSWVAVSGQLNLSSEWLPGLPPERLDILKRTMPGHGLRPRPVDLFDQDLPSVWTVSDTRQATRRDVVGLFNWATNAQTFEYAMDRLGLDPAAEYVGFDYWADALVPSMQGKLQVSVPGQSCVVVAVRPKANQPQLISTSRHVLSGMVDVVEERWDAATKTLSGRSQVVGGDPYELRIAVPSGWTVNSTQASGAEIQPGSPSEGLVRASIRTPASREVSWSVKFN